MQFCISRATSATTAQVLRATKVCCSTAAAATALMEFRTMLYYSTNTTAVL